MTGTAALMALLLLGTLVLVWQLLHGMRELALREAARACEGAGLQLLDMSVALDRLRLARRQAGWAWQLDYRFDVSHDGSSRQHGRLRFLGGQLEWIEMPTADASRELWMGPRGEPERPRPPRWG